MFHATDTMYPPKSSYKCSNTTTTAYLVLVYFSLTFRYSNGPFTERRNRRWNVRVADDQAEGGISGEDTQDLQRNAIAVNVGRGCRAVQRDAQSEQVDRVYRPNVLHRQSGVASHMHARPKTLHANVQRPESLDIQLHVRHHGLLQISRSTEHRSEKIASQPGTIPQATLLRAGVRAASFAKCPPVHNPDGPGIDAEVVSREQHVRLLRPEIGQVPHGGCDLQRQDVDQGRETRPF